LLEACVSQIRIQSSARAPRTISVKDVIPVSELRAGTQSRKA
jgi:hypothetical protein